MSDPIADIAAAASAPLDAPDMRDGQVPDVAPNGGDAIDRKGAPENCPIAPLGFLGQRNYFLDSAGQLIELGSEFRKGEIMQLFNKKIDWPKWQWPVKKEVIDKTTGEKEWITVGFDQKIAQEDMIDWCGRAGLFDPTNKVRGRGAHRGSDGELVLHCGAHVLIGGKRGTRNNVLLPKWAKAGLIGGHVYPTAPALELPADDAAPVVVGRQLLAHIESWNWKRKSTDPYMLMCWMAAAMIGGALKWRPHGWITGPSGAGKSDLQKFLQSVLRGWAVTCEDATEAGVRQSLNQDTLAVMFDEIEPDEHNGDVHMKIVKLARLASSGGNALRGTQDHKSKQFVARSCFLFSSIHHHELPAQDRNRMAILHLAKFPPQAQAPILPATFELWGGQLQRRIVEQWHRFDATLRVYQAEMLKQGYSGREQAQYGTLLAAGDLFLYDDVPGSVAGADADRHYDLVDNLGPMLDSARSEAESTTERSIRYLASRLLPSEHGKAQEPVGRWLSRALIDVINRTDAKPARNKLRSYGMRIVQLKANHREGNGQGGLIDAYMGDGALYLAVANKTNSGMTELFKGSIGKDGQWTQHLALVDGAVINKKSRFDGPPEGCILVPLGEVIDVDAARTEAAAEIAAARFDS